MGPILAMDISFWHMFFWLCWSYSLLVTLSVCYIECWVSLGILGIQNKQCNDCIVHYVVCNFTVEKYLQVIKDYLQSPEWVSNFLPSEESSTWLAEISCIEAMPSCQSSTNFANSSIILKQIYNYIYKNLCSSLELTFLFSLLNPSFLTIAKYRFYSK